MKKYHIVYEGKKLRKEYNGFPDAHRDNIIFKNLSNGKDFVLNKVFFENWTINNDTIFINY